MPHLRYRQSCMQFRVQVCVHQCVIHAIDMKSSRFCFVHGVEVSGHVRNFSLMQKPSIIVCACHLAQGVFAATKDLFSVRDQQFGCEPPIAGGVRRAEVTLPRRFAQRTNSISRLKSARAAGCVSPRLPRDRPRSGAHCWGWRRRRNDVGGLLHAVSYRRLYGVSFPSVQECRVRQFQEVLYGVAVPHQLRTKLGSLRNGPREPLVPFGQGHRSIAMKRRRAMVAFLPS